jgi:periplasmic divalent cation tolerance protein
MTDAMRVETTIDSQDAATELARQLVERRLVACAQIVGPISSTYWWEGKVSTETEYLVVCKTAKDRVEELRVAINELHSYDVPEILAVEIDSGNPAYLDWVAAETRAQ